MIEGYATFIATVIHHPLAVRPAITVESLTKTFDGQTVLDDISMTIPAGAIVGLIGPSGCGKTTLVRCLAGLIPPTAGRATVFGEDPRTFTTRQRTRFGYMPQLPVLFPNLTVRGNLNFVASLYGVPIWRRRKRLVELLDLVDLESDGSKKLADCSGGMQRRLALAATLVHEPELLFLDEPTAGVDPILRERFWAYFRSLRDRGKTIVVPTQYVGEAVSCDLVAVMVAGHLVTVERPDRLARVAYGGAPVAIELDGYLSRDDAARLSTIDGVRSVRPSEAGLVVAVDAPGDDHSRVIDLLRQTLASVGASVGDVKPLEPTFDEIFFEIVESFQRSRLTKESVV